MVKAANLIVGALIGWGLFKLVGQQSEPPAESATSPQEQYASTVSNPQVVGPPVPVEDNNTIQLPESEIVIKGDVQSIPQQGTRISGDIAQLSNFDSLKNSIPSNKRCDGLGGSARNACFRRWVKDKGEWYRQLRAIRSSVQKGAREADKEGRISYDQRRQIEAEADRRFTELDKLFLEQNR